MPLQIEPRQVNVNLSNAVNKPFLTLARVWAIAKWVIILAVVVGIPLLVVLIWKWWNKKNASVQDFRRWDLQKSAIANKRDGIKYVYIYEEGGLRKLGEYLGETKNKDGKITYLYVLFPKGKFGGVFESILSFLPDVIYDLIFERGYLIATPTNAVKKMQIDGKKAVIFSADGLEYDGNLKIFKATGHIGFPKRVLAEFLEGAEEEYLHKFVREVQKVLDNALEVNPFVSAKLKVKQEREEEGDEYEK